MTMYIIRETTEYVAMVNGEERVLKRKVRIPVSTDSLVDALVYGRKFMDNRVRMANEETEGLVEVRDDRGTDNNEISLLMSGDTYCECVYKNEDDVIVIEKLFCKLEKV